MGPAFPRPACHAIAGRLGLLLMLGAWGLCVPAAAAQTTYLWNGGAAAPWNVSTSWSPPRAAPKPDDVLIFSGPGTITVTAIPRERIGQCLLLGNVTVNLQAALAVDTLSFTGGAGPDLSVASGSALNINSVNALLLYLESGATASVSGNMTFTTGPHRLDAADAGAIVFNFAATFTQGANCSGAVFTTTGTPGAVQFASGATFVSLAGGAPFGLGAPASKVRFLTGAFYKHRQGGAPELAGRTYANFDWNPPGAATQTAGGADTLTLDNLTITAGRLNVALASEIRLRGRLQVASGATLDFDPPAPGTLAFAGSAPQLVQVSGTLLLRAAENVAVRNPVGVALLSPVTLNGATHVEAGALLSTGSTLTNLGTVTADGTFQLSQGGAVIGWPFLYGAGGTLLYSLSSGTLNVTTDDRAWPDSQGPTHVTLLATGAATTLALQAPRTVPGQFRTTGRVGIAGGPLTLSGTCRIEAGGRFLNAPTFGPAALLLYATGGIYARGPEWSAPGGAGYPASVRVAAGTTLDVTSGGTGGAPLSLAGGLTVDAGATLTLDRSGGLTSPVRCGGGATIAGTLELSSRPGGDFELAGDWSAPGTLLAHGRAVRFTGPAPQRADAAGPFDGLTLDNPAGLTLDTDVEVNGPLEFLAGRVTTGAHRVRLGVAGHIVGAGAARYVAGTLEMPVGATPDTAAVRFEIGDAATWAPVTLRLAAVTSAEGRVTARTAAGDHARIADAGLDPAQTVNRTWTLEADNLAFATASALLRFSPADRDSGLLVDSLGVARYAGGAWHETTRGALTDTSVTALGLTEFGDFQLGVAAQYTITAIAGAHGSVTPAEVVKARHGENRTFLITPAAGFAVEDVKVDGASVGAARRYTFANVAADHHLYASFRDSQCPSAFITGPLGGETFIIGLTGRIHWSASDNVGVTGVELRLSRAGNWGPFETVAADLPNTGHYDWPIQGPATAQALWMIVAHDAAGNACPQLADTTCAIVDYPTPVARTDLAARMTTAGVLLTWEPPADSDVAGCRVERSDDAAGPFVALSVTRPAPDAAVRRSSWEDVTVQVGQRYFYRVAFLGRAGAVRLSETLELHATPPGDALAVERAAGRPGGVSLRLTLATGAPTQVALFDVQGRRVATLWDGPLDAGWHHLEWDGALERGRAPAGLYFARATTPERTLVTRFVYRP